MFLGKRTLCALLTAAGLGAAAVSQAALLGLTLNEPTIDVAAGAVITYNATNGTVTISGTPQLLQQAVPFLFGEFVGTGTDDEKLFTIQFRIDGSGNFVSGVDGPDLIIKGAVDTDFDGVVDYDGILLEAEVTQFGFENGAAGANDRFDIRLGTVTGLLAPLYAGKELSVVVDSEPSVDYPLPFAGDFGLDFVAPAKAVLGSVEPLAAAACMIDVQAYCSVNGGPNKSVCRISVTKSPKHWEHVTHYAQGHMFRVYKYGMHGDPVPSWASRYAATDVKFTYVVTNTGTTPIGNLQLVDSFDIGISDVPATLAPGQSVTLMRTEALRDGMIDSVIVSGESGGSMCMGKDTVAVKDKVRHKRAHDHDRFKEKDSREDRR